MRNKKNIIMVVMCIAVFVMAVGYAVFSTNLNIGATGNINTTWGISITNITSKVTGTAVNIADPTYTGVNATFNAGFYKPGDKVEYSIKVSNTGTIDAIISDVIINTSGSKDIIYTVKNLEKNTKLSKGTNVTFKIVAEFDVNATAIPVISEKTINMVLVVMQDAGNNPTPIAPEITDTTTQYGIMYVANGGNGTMDGTVCQVGQTCTLTTNTFAREGYRFKGWSKTPNGSVVSPDKYSGLALANPGETLVLYAVWDDLKLVSQIMNDNSAQADTNIDFSKISSSTNGKGLYYTSTNTEMNKTTYYFRGNVNNNYVKFGTYTKNACMYKGKEVVHMDHYGEFYGGYVPSMTEEECKSYPVCETAEGEYVVGWVEESDASDAHGFCTNNLGGQMPGEYATYEPIQADLWWRIVRINEDGSVRLITQDSVGESVFNTNYDDNAYVGYMYGLPETDTIYGDIDEDGTIGVRDSVLLAQYISDWDLGLTKRQILLADMNFDGKVTEEDAEIHAQVKAGWSYNLDNYSSTGRYNKTHANINDSTVKTYLDNWYVNNLSNYSSYLADAGFCNDRSVATEIASGELGYGTIGTPYKTYYRLSQLKKPQFGCVQSNDLFTTPSSVKGNKALTYPIGLMTADEVAYAGGVRGVANQNMYLANNKLFWTMSPDMHISRNAVIGAVYANGTLNAYVANYSTDYMGVRPVINLKSATKISNSVSSGCTEQNGTEICPYIIDAILYGDVN